MPGLSQDPCPLQPACGQHLLLFVFLMVATLTKVRWDLCVFWLVVSWFLKIFSWPFLFFLLRNFFSVHLPLYLSDHLIFWMLIFMLFIILDTNSLCEYIPAQFRQHHLWKGYPLSNVCFEYLCSKSDSYNCKNLFLHHIFYSIGPYIYFVLALCSFCFRCYCGSVVYFRWGIVVTSSTASSKTVSLASFMLPIKS